MGLRRQAQPWIQKQSQRLDYRCFSPVLPLNEPTALIPENVSRGDLGTSCNSPSWAPPCILLSCSLTIHSNIALSKTAATRQQNRAGSRQQRARLLCTGNGCIPTAAREWKDPAWLQQGLAGCPSMPFL